MTNSTKQRRSNRVPSKHSVILSVYDSSGAEAVKEHGTTLPQPLLDSIKRNKIALKGPITTPIGKGFTSVNVGLRKALDLYANLGRRLGRQKVLEHRRRPAQGRPLGDDPVIEQGAEQDVGLHAQLEREAARGGARGRRCPPSWTRRARRCRGRPRRRSGRASRLRHRLSKRCRRSGPDARPAPRASPGGRRGGRTPARRPRA